MDDIDSPGSGFSSPNVNSRFVPSTPVNLSEAKELIAELTDPLELANNDRCM